MKNSGFHIGVSLDPDETGLALYPHPDGFCPGAPAQIAEKLPEGQRRTVLAESAMPFYNLS